MLRLLWAGLCVALLLTASLRTSAAEKRTLTVASIHEDLLPGLRKVLPEFEAHTGWKVVAQAVPYSAHEMWIRTQMLSGQPPDVVLVEAADLSTRYGQADLLIRWDDLTRQPNRFDTQHPSRPWIDAFSLELIQQGRDATGALWCIPYTQYGVGFFYNQQVYAGLKLQPPRTWEELLANFRTVRSAGHAAFVTAIRPTDHQTIWMADMLMDLFLRPVAAEVNLQARPGWHFDALDPECTRGEIITLEERLVAFERGLIDPAKAPAFRETARLMRQLAREFRPDFLSIDGNEVPRIFARGQAVHFLNGTWYLRPLAAMHNGIAEIAPERVFPWGVFPFPDLTAETTALPRLGGINQNIGLRASFIVPRRTSNLERQQAAIDLVRFLTAPRVAQTSFEQTEVYDLPAMPDVAPKAQAKPLIANVRYAFLTLALFRGYDARSEGEFWTLWQGFLGGAIGEEEFVQQLSRIHRGGLLRLAQANAAILDREFLEKHLPGGFAP